MLGSAMFVDTLGIIRSFYSLAPSSIPFCHNTPTLFLFYFLTLVLPQVHTRYAC